MKNTIRQFLESIGRYNQVVDDYKRARESSPDHALAHVNWGIELAQAGKLEEALEKFQQASEIAPNRYEPFFNWGVALAQGKRSEEAIEKLKAAIDRNPNASGAYILWGALLVEQGLLPEAQEKYERAIALNPQSPEPYANWGTVLARHGAYVDAVARFKQALSLKGSQPQLFFLWGTVLSELKDYEGAIDKFRLALRFMPGHADSYHFWSIVLNQLGRYEDALEKSGMAIRYDAKNPQFYLNQGDVLMNMERLDESIVNYRQAATLSPELWEAYLGWGVALCRQQKYAEGEEKFRQCLELQPDCAEAHSQWGKVLLDQERFFEALEHLQAGAALEPDNVTALLNLALAYLKTGLREDAIKTLFEVEKRDKWNAQAHYLLGTHFLGIGEPDKALTHLSKALEEKPDFEDAAVNLSLALCERGDTLEAVRHMRPIIRRLPDSPRINFYYGVVLDRNGDWDDAIVKYRKAIKLDPLYPEPAIGLVEIYLRQGRLEEAENVLKALLKHTPRFIPALFLLGVCRIRQADAAPSMERKRFFDQKALESFELIRNLDPAHLEAQVNQALMLGRMQSLDTMNQAFENILQQHSSDQKALLLYYWAQALDQQGDRPAAALKLQEARRVNPQISDQITPL